jgi:guanylate kinase
MKPLIIVVSAPSGVGKTTICKRVINLVPNLRLSCSATTRAKRRDEKEGVDYYFVSRRKFKELITRGELIEWVFVHNHYYGTLWKEIDSAFKNGVDLLLDIEVSGAKEIKRRYQESILVFILPPSLKEWERRLRERNTESAESYQERLRWGLKEIEAINNYEYVIINTHLEEAVEDLKSIIISERCRNRDIKSFLGKFKRGSKKQ